MLYEKPCARDIVTSRKGLHAKTPETIGPFIVQVHGVSTVSYPLGPPDITQSKRADTAFNHILYILGVVVVFVRDKAAHDPAKIEGKSLLHLRESHAGFNYQNLVTTVQKVTIAFA